MALWRIELLQDTLTSWTDLTHTSTTNALNITSAGTVTFGATDVLTGADSVTFGNVAIALTLNDAATVVVQSGASTATESVVFGDGSFAQSVTYTSTGAVDFSFDTANFSNEAKITMVSNVGATTTFNVTGVGGGVPNMTSFNMNGANLDVINVGAVSGATVFNFLNGTYANVLQTNTNGVLSGPTVNAVETGAAVTYSFLTDYTGAANHVLTIAGFDVGATGDVLILGSATVVLQTGIVMVGATALEQVAGSFTDALELSGAAFQVGGNGVVGSNLAAIGNAGTVEAAIIAAGIRPTTFASGKGFYVLMDNGVDTGVYQVTEGATDTGTAGVLDMPADFSVVLVAKLVGVADCGTVDAANIS